MANILHRLCRDEIEQIHKVAFRRPTSLRDMLVHSELKTPGDIRGCLRCGDRRCRVCDFLVEGTDLKSNVANSNFVINFSL